MDIFHENLIAECKQLLLKQYFLPQTQRCEDHLVGLLDRLQKRWWSFIQLERRLWLFHSIWLRLIDQAEFIGESQVFYDESDELELKQYIVDALFGCFFSQNSRNVRIWLVFKLKIQTQLFFLEETLKLLQILPLLSLLLLLLLLLIQQIIYIPNRLYSDNRLIPSLTLYKVL